MKEIESIIIFPQYLRAKLMKIVIMKMVTAMPVSANAPLILSMPKIVQFPDVSSYSQSHYIEVLRCLSQSNTKLIVNIQPIFAKKNLKRDIMQLFSADATMFLKNFQHFFAHEDKKNRPKIAHNWPDFFFSIASLPKISPKFILYHILFHKNGSLHNFYVQTLHTVNLCVSFYIYINISIHTSQLNSTELVLEILEGEHKFEKENQWLSL